MKLTEEVLTEVKQMLRNKDFGILSTVSKHLEGCPFGSVANYCLGHNGMPLLYFSTIAQHTSNLTMDNRASLTIIANGGGNVQSEARLTISGQIQRLEKDSAELERYHRYFPESAEYSKFHDFALFVLNPSAVRYIGGFGKIFWIEPKLIFEASPLSITEAKFVLDHMNDQHTDNLYDYIDQHPQSNSEDSTPIEMIGIDSMSIDIRYEGKRKNVFTDGRVTDAKSAREILVKMAR